MLDIFVVSSIKSTLGFIVVKQISLFWLQNGIVLRVSFCQPLELALLRKFLRSNNSRLSKKRSVTDLDNSIHQPEALHRWLVFYDRLPAITSQLMTISRSNLHTYPEACRLAKRWLSAHGYPVIQNPDLCDEPPELNLSSIRLGDSDLGSTHCRLSEIAVELMIVHAGGFTPTVQTPSYSAGLSGVAKENFSSCSPLAVFLRFLRLLYSFDWENNVLLVDLNEGFSESEQILQKYYD